MIIKDKSIDGGKGFDWGKVSTEYAKYRDIYPQMFYQKILDLGLCRDGQRILDIGTGSGCIAITLAKEFPYASVCGIDISSQALEVAKRNNNLLEGNVTLIHGDCLKEVKDKKFDVVISNPPYISNDEFVSKTVIDYEPHIALFASNHGLEIYEKIFMDLDDVLNEDGIALFEISPPLKDRLTSLIEKYLPLYTYEFIKDINGFTRFLFLNK